MLQVKSMIVQFVELICIDNYVRPILFIDKEEVLPFPQW